MSGSTLLPIATLWIVRLLTWIKYDSNQRPILLRFEYLDNHPSVLDQMVGEWIFSWMYTQFKSKDK